MTGSNGGQTWPAELSAAASALLAASDSAHETGRSNWDFAIQIARLYDQNLTSTGLRVLIREGFIDHADEVTDDTADTRIFELTDALRISSRTCVILMPLGRAAAQSLLSARSRTAPQAQRNTPQPTAIVSLPEASLATPSTETPTSLLHIPPLWKPDLKRLTFGVMLVKQYRHPAPNQELILGVFQEEGWPERIDDPLSPILDLEPKQRLHQAINGLNRHQRNRLLHFGGDGTGTGILWQSINPSPSG